MPVTAAQVKQLRAGASDAHGHDLHRLERLLAGLATLARMTIDGSGRDVEITLPDVIDAACAVARDVSRSDQPSPG